MNKKKQTLILTNEDYALINNFLNSGWGNTRADMQQIEALRTELKKAVILPADNVPADVVRINSRVRIKADDRNEEMELIVVTPENADLKQMKVSLLAPIGTALIGFRKGQQIKWKVPSGNRMFTILDVVNEAVNQAQEA